MEMTISIMIFNDQLYSFECKVYKLFIIKHDQVSTILLMLLNISNNALEFIFLSSVDLDVGKPP